MLNINRLCLEIFRRKTIKTKPIYGNCFFATIYLILRGKAKVILGVSCHSPWWPHHYLITNDNGHAITFNHIHPDKDNKFAPFWFEGQFVGIRKRKLNLILKRQKRKVLFITKNVEVALFLFILVYLMMAIPWCLSWTFYTVAWSIKWAIHALIRH